MEYRIDKRYLKVILDTKSKSLVGRILKRIETIDDEKTLKEEVKNVLYEEFRDIFTTLEAYHQGTLFSLRQKDSTQ